jgi:hypothetical protein
MLCSLRLQMYQVLVPTCRTAPTQHMALLIGILCHEALPIFRTEQNHRSVAQAGGWRLHLIDMVFGTRGLGGASAPSMVGTTVPGGCPPASRSRRELGAGGGSCEGHSKFVDSASWVSSVVARSTRSSDSIHRARVLFYTFWVDTRIQKTGVNPKGAVRRM